jgi:hypothetical protein
MKIQQKKFSKINGWETIRTDDFDFSFCSLVMAFASKSIFEGTDIYSLLKKEYPRADILFNSTAGEIIDTQVHDDTISLTAIAFEKTNFKTASVSINEVNNSYEAGKHLALKFNPHGLKNVLVISDGQKVNGSELVIGLQESLPAGTIITGGLAGDGPEFQKTLVGLNESPIEGRIAAIGFYGTSIQIACGTVGGWSPFGPERLVTKSKDNVLYELDGKPALDIYKMYLGEYVKELPGSALLFPLGIRTNEIKSALVRTILSINERERSLTFAGNIPTESYARLMRANPERLIEGASEAALDTLKQNVQPPDLAILISCVGRKLVLGQRIEEEVEVIRNIYGNRTVLTGFYSYGEISPSLNLNKSELHNQTMTITTFTEAELC